MSDIFIRPTDDRRPPPTRPTGRSGMRGKTAPLNAMGANVTIQKNWQELIRPNKLQVAAGADAQARGDAGRRAARARLRRDARQRAAPHSAVLAAGRGGAVGAHRRRAARVLVDPRRARGRDRHRPQHQGHRHQDAGRRPQAHGGEEARVRAPSPPATSRPSATSWCSIPTSCSAPSTRAPRSAWSSRSTPARATCRPSATVPRTRRSA